MAGARLTTGIDEAGELGEKKRRKSLAALKESDVGVLVVDVSRQQQQQGQQLDLDQLRKSLHWEVQLLKDAAHYQVSIFMSCSVCCGCLLCQVCLSSMCGMGTVSKNHDCQPLSTVSVCRRFVAVSWPCSCSCLCELSHIFHNTTTPIVKCLWRG